MDIETGRLLSISSEWGKQDQRNGAEIGLMGIFGPREQSYQVNPLMALQLNLY